MTSLSKSKQVLQQNEDVMAAIVENMQIGRLDDCKHLYSLLHRNLMSMAHDLDNYPTFDQDPFASLDIFPDKILRSDVIDEIRPPGEVILPKPPLPPPCVECFKNKRTSKQCREELNHVQPSHKFSNRETEEFIHATEVLAEAHRNWIMDKMTGKKKRNYQRWNNSEKYTLMVAMSILGIKETHRIADLLEDRTENQVRSFIAKNFDANALQEISEGRLPSPPPMYFPPKRLALLFADPNSRARLKNNKDVDKLMASAVAPTSASQPGGWNTLLSLVTGVPQGFSESSLPSSAHSKQSELDNEAALALVSGSGHDTGGTVKRATSFKYSASLHRSKISDSPQTASSFSGATDVNGDLLPDTIHIHDHNNNNNGNNEGREDDTMDVVCLEDDVQVEYGALHGLLHGQEQISDGSAVLDHTHASSGSSNNKFGLFVRPIWKKSTDVKSSTPTASTSQLPSNMGERYADMGDNNSIVQSPTEPPKVLFQRRKYPANRKPPRSKGTATVDMVGDASAGVEAGTGADVPTKSTKKSPSAANGDDHRLPKPTTTKKKKSVANADGSEGSGGVSTKQRKPKATSSRKSRAKAASVEEQQQQQQHLAPENDSEPFGHVMYHVPHVEHSLGGHPVEGEEMNVDQGSLTGFDDGTTSFFGASTFMEGIDFSFSNPGSY